MAGDWIKVRPSLLTSPKVNGIARLLESSSEVARKLSTDFNGVMSEIVTRDVMRDVTLASLVRVWGAANEHSRDGVFDNTDKSDIDDIAGIVGFADAMEANGWLEYDEQETSITLPNFNEYNSCGKERQQSKAAERQKRYREKKKAEAVDSDALSNVTRDVTRNDREEKRREDNNSLSSAHESFAMHFDWQPSDNVQARLRMMGQDPEKLTDELLGKFKNHHTKDNSPWQTQNQWEVALCSWVANEKTGGSNAAGRQSGATGAGYDPLDEFNVG